MDDITIDAAPTTAPETPSTSQVENQSEVRDETPAKKAFDEIMAATAEEDTKEPGSSQVQTGKAEEGLEGEVSSDSQTGETVAAAAKVLKAKKGDSLLEIPDDAVLTIKVNKEDVEVPVKDLVRNYQGKIPWEKQFQQTIEHEKEVKRKETELNTAYQQFVKQRAAEDDHFREVVELARTNPSEALMRACIKVGKSPAQILRAVIEQSRATVAQLDQMTPEQVELLIAQKSLDYDKAVVEYNGQVQKQQQEERQALTGLEQHVTQRCNQHRITAAEYAVSEEMLRDALQAGAVKLNGETPTQIVDLIIEQIIQYDRPRNRLRTILESVDPKSAKNRLVVADLHQHLGGSDLTEYSDDDLNEIMRGVFGGNGASEPAKEPVQVQATADSSMVPATKPSARKIPQGKQKPRMEVGDDDDPLSIDDIKRSYRRMVS